MPLGSARVFVCVSAAVVLLGGMRPAGQRTGLPIEEVVARRQALMREVGHGLVVLFGNERQEGAGHFAQDNDFYYLTGRDDANAILVMAPKSGQSFLFLPEQNPREIMIEGANLLKDPHAAEVAGVTAVHPLTYFDEFLARNLVSNGLELHVRLSPHDTVAGARYESALMVARRSRIHYNDQLPIDQYRLVKLRERYPAATLRDVTPLVDAMRVIKTPAEITVMRRNGQISAEGVRQAMLASRPGVFEYEIEAAAMGYVLKRGARGPAYAPIVGSGPNTCVWHYDDNGRQAEAGDLVLMDFGAQLDHLTMDITRTWPVSGKFTQEQRRVYEQVLEVEKACIDAYRPGVTEADVKRAVADALKRKGIDAGGLEGGFGHHVGLATHDVGAIDRLREGMVFAIEPALYFPDKQIGIRVEDTVLITRDGCEVLTRGVPKEIAEIEALLATRR
ncbi:MAG TPA: Xaa-Pro peptidase family protein [Vicinamibacterales bacterium]|jgi:Xaa-Pro aminopeptidase